MLGMNTGLRTLGKHPAKLCAQFQRENSMFLFPSFQISSEIKSKFKPIPLGEDEAIVPLAELSLGQILEFPF